MTYATLTGTTVTLTFPLAAAEGLRHAITMAIHERPTSERDMLASIYGALVNPQPAPTVRAACAPVDVLAVMDALIHYAAMQSGGVGRDYHEQARAAIADLIEAASAAEFHLTREHRAPMTVDAADYVTEVERDRNKLRAALARVSGGGK